MAFLVTSNSTDTIATHIFFDIEKCFQYFLKWKIKPIIKKTCVILSINSIPNINTYVAFQKAQ